MERLTSLDTFRGVTIAFMILVNNPGKLGPGIRAIGSFGLERLDLYRSGLSVILWMVGVSMTLSFTKRLARGDGRGKLMAHAARRSALIVIVAFALNQFPLYAFEYFRIPGVLQRIAVCYVIAASIWLFGGTRGIIASIFVLLAGYWMLMTLYPVPAFGPGVLTKRRQFREVYRRSGALRAHVETNAGLGSRRESSAPARNPRLRSSES